VLPASTLNTIGAASETFTPIIIGSGGGAVTIGDGTFTGNFFRLQRLIVVTYFLQWGSTTTTTTSGLWLFSVPTFAGAVRGNGAGRILDAGNTYHRVTALAGSNSMILQATDTGSEVQSTVPMTWANGDTLSVTFIYETSA